MLSISEQFESSIKSEIQSISKEELTTVLPSIDNTKTPLIQITLNPGELVNISDRYRAMWNMFFIDKNWFFYRNNGKKLGAIFPAFIATEFEYSPFGENKFQPISISSENENNENKAELQILNELFTSHFLILPFKIVNKYTIKFIGAHFNKYETSARSSNSTNNLIYTVNTPKVHLRALCVFDYFVIYDNFASLSDCIPLRKTIFGGKSSVDIIKILNICEDYLYTHEMGVI